MRYSILSLIAFLAAVFLAWGFGPLLSQTAEAPDAVCDSSLALASNDPVDAAKAIDICDSSLVSASWVMGNGAPAVASANYHLGHGILPAFGTNVVPQLGSKLLALSSGTARQPTDPGYQAVNPGFDKGYTAGYSYPWPYSAADCSLGSCATPGNPFDDAALQVVLQVPENAVAAYFDWKFYTTDYHDFACSSFNDTFTVHIDPPVSGKSEIVLDASGSPISVNSDDLLSVCTANLGGACYACAAGTSELNGTGFEGHGATQWNETGIPVTAGSTITLTFVIFDSSDGIFDATVLLDNFRWDTFKESVSDLNIGLSDSDVDLTWTALPGTISHYEIYRDSDYYFLPDPTGVYSNAKAASFTDPGAAGILTPYVYLVKGIEMNSGARGPESNRVGKFAYPLVPPP